LKIELAIIGVILAVLIGYLIGALIENPVGSGGYPVIGALLGALVAITALALGESLKDTKTS
jgi:NAD/NADP transhydrogenase beta subunit